MPLELQHMRGRDIAVSLTGHVDPAKRQTLLVKDLVVRYSPGRISSDKDFVRARCAWESTADLPTTLQELV